MCAQAPGARSESALLYPATSARKLTLCLVHGMNELMFSLAFCASGCTACTVASGLGAAS